MLETNLLLNASNSKPEISKKLSASSYNSPRFWPDRDKHVVAIMKLEDPADSNLSAEAIDALQQATQLSEALRTAEDLQARGGTHGDGLVSYLRSQLAVALNNAASSLGCPDSAKSLRLRASILLGADPKPIQSELVALRETELVSICGTLGTWLGKSRLTYHSAIFALPDPALNDLINRIDEQIQDTEAVLRAIVDPRLTIDRPPSISFAQLMFCGGEANLYPKHFAYFLPEDEGYKRSPQKKTLVLTNVYREMYRRVSMPFSENIIVTPAKEDPSTTEIQLALWFRGHDTGHGVRLPGTDFVAMRCEGRWLSMVMQEAMADVFGFLMCTSEPWSCVAPMADRDAAATIFLREMLRYLCRGGHDFPDAGAALIQLSFLSKNGFVDLSINHGPRLSTTPDRLRNGMVALGKLFTSSVLSNDKDLMRGMINQYYINGERDFIASCGVCDFVLDYSQYLSSDRKAA